MRGTLTVLALALLLPLGAAAQETSTASAAEIPTDKDLANTRCIIGEEKFLPSDYYYCLAAQSYGQKKYRYAVQFFKDAAGWGSKQAQYVLGVMALNGDHQPVDRALALAWLSLAAERPGSRFAGPYNEVLKQSTPRERDAAKALLAKMAPVYADATAAARAEARYTGGLALLRNSTYYCMAGMWEPGREPSVDNASDGSSCPHVEVLAAQLDKTAAEVFEGWQGHVAVGALQPVNKP
ncbi:MAG TPA: hypothetical protein VIM98_00210 [Dyella sp.]|uniref:hypothetical protein n=1 Tax=Dyella sp. TaxID=1869338 RepID=UPI002F950F33